MKMIDVLHMPRRIWLGRKTEQNYRPIAFDVYKWLTDYPEATVSIVYTRPDGEVFPVASSDRSPIIWIPQQDVTAVSGEGEIELHLVGGGSVGISASTKTLIDDSASSAQPTAPSWVDRVVEDVTEQADRAEAAVSHYPQIVNGVWFVWDAEQSKFVSTGISAQGEDGVSPTVQIEPISGGHRVTVTDYEGSESFDVMDGEGGSSGGAVDSVNGKTGVVVLDASDVGALPDDTPIPAAVTEQTVSGWGFTKNTGTYSKPSGGIPASDLADDMPFFALPEGGQSGQALLSDGNGGAYWGQAQGGGGSGLSENAKTLILALFRAAIYNSDFSSLVSQLDEEFNGSSTPSEVTISQRGTTLIFSNVSNITNIAQNGTILTLT